MNKGKRAALTAVAAALFIAGAVPFSGALNMKGKAILGDLSLIHI